MHCKCVDTKGIVHPEINILSSFTHAHKDDEHKDNIWKNVSQFQFWDIFPFNRNVLSPVGSEVCNLKDAKVSGWVKEMSYIVQNAT